MVDQLKIPYMFIKDNSVKHDPYWSIYIALWLTVGYILQHIFLSSSGQFSCYFDLFSTFNRGLISRTKSASVVEN